MPGNVTTGQFVLGKMAMSSPGANEAQDRTRGVLPQATLPKVLIVDDSRDSVNLLSSLFGAHGYEVHVAYDWAIALETAKTHHPDVILLDLGMPEMDGIHLALLFREDEQLKDRVLIAVTGYADDKHRQQCEAAGFDCVLAKPVAWTDLHSTVDRLWSNRNAP